MVGLRSGAGQSQVVCHATERMSVSVKSLPLNNNGSSKSLAGASAKQSPKFTPALCLPCRNRGMLVGPDGPAQRSWVRCRSQHGGKRHRPASSLSHGGRSSTVSEARMSAVSFRVVPRRGGWASNEGWDCPKSVSCAQGRLLGDNRFRDRERPNPDIAFFRNTRLAVDPGSGETSRKRRSGCYSRIPGRHRECFGHRPATQEHRAFSPAVASDRSSCLFPV